MNQANQLILLLILTTTSSLAIYKLNVFKSFILQIFVFGLYILTKSMAEAYYMGNEKECREEIFNYKKRVRESRMKIKEFLQ